MSDQDNPYATGGGQYVASTSPGNGATASGFSLGGAEAAPAPAPVKDTTTASFVADVIEESRKQPVLVDFWAPWCGPCKQLAPALEKAVAEAGGRVRLVKMNIDDHPAIAGQLGIQSIPAVIAFKNGQPVDGFMGAVPESQIREFINRVAGDSGKDEIAEAVAAAAEAREAGDDQTAMQIYSAILQQAPDNVDALAGLADILFEAGQVDRAREILDRTPEAKQDAAPIAAVKAKLTLAEQVAELGGADELESRLAANPKDHQARFDLALIQNAKGMRDEAADNLLAIIKTDRAWQDDAARSQLLKFFDAWGQTDEATLTARRKLSSILFS